MAKTAFMVGVDLGGTKIAAGLVSPRGTIRHRVKIASEAHTKKERVLQNLIRSIESCLAAGDAGAIGIGCAGSVDPVRGVFRGGANMPKDWKDVPLVQILKRRFKLPVYIDNDVNIIALAEQRWGKARRMSSAFVVTIGTGIGGAFLLDGGLVRGAHFAAGEPGHMIISERHERCACGKYGHFEAFVGGRALEYVYKKRSGRASSTYDIIREARRGRRDAIAVLQDMRTHLAVGIANILKLVDPQVVILGGGLSAVPLLVRGIQKDVAPLLTYRANRNARIVTTSMRNTAGILGGAALTMEGKTP